MKRVYGIPEYPYYIRIKVPGQRALWETEALNHPRNPWNAWSQAKNQAYLINYP